MAEKNNIHIEDIIDVKELQTLQDDWAKQPTLLLLQLTVTAHRLRNRVISRLFVKSYVRWISTVNGVIIVMPVVDEKPEESVRHMSMSAMRD